MAKYRFLCSQLERITPDPAVDLLGRSPRKLLVVATGNITNDALLSLFELHLNAIVSAFGEADFVELSRDVLALGRRREDADS